MCGIFGYVGWDRELPPLDSLRRVTGLLQHRGPDERGYWHGRNTYFGHCRLAIIGLADGQQPMAGAGDRFVITFNGEIYNYVELRDALRREGVAFRTASDTEVLLAGYTAWGPAVIERLEGMFALAIYDRRERTLLLARDRFGEKPLLYADDGGTVAFASELAPLVSIGAGARALDLDALGAYLCLNYVPGDRTLLRGVRRLRPGHWRLYDAEGLREERCYFSPAALPRVPIDPAHVLDQLQARLDEAVRLTLRSDVPVGLFLSGGVDSALVAESAARQGHVAAAFSVDFTPGVSEWTRASFAAAKLGIELVRVPMRGDELGEFMDLVRHLDDPLADSSAIAVWAVARAARERVKVVLSGDGGDELFAGYPAYRVAGWHHQIRRLLPPAAWTALARLADRTSAGTIRIGGRPGRLLRALALTTSEAHFTWNGTWTPAEAMRLARPGPLQASIRASLSALAAEHALPPAPTLHDLQRMDLSEYMVNDILAKVDRATMAHGLESRAPFLNAGVAALALSLPDDWRMQGRTTKVALRRLCARHFGQEHAYARKQGFSVPLNDWLRTGGRALLQELLEPARVEALGVLEPQVVTRLVHAHLTGAQALGAGLWGLMVLVAWYENRVAAPPDARYLPDPALTALTLPA
ncbi:MAG: asparagine synthase (glutamine-hydrolyzing) [Vicinamibacterales bacterium]